MYTDKKSCLVPLGDVLKDNLIKNLKNQVEFMNGYMQGMEIATRLLISKIQTRFDIMAAQLDMEVLLLKDELDRNKVNT